LVAATVSVDEVPATTDAGLAVTAIVGTALLPPPPVEAVDPPPQPVTTSSRGKANASIKGEVIQEKERVAQVFMAVLRSQFIGYESFGRDR
jgi:hypothetical protein